MFKHNVSFSNVFISEEDRDELLVSAIEEMIKLASTSECYTLVYFQADQVSEMIF